MEKVKPGVKTSEFWGKMIVQVVLVIVLFGGVSSEQVSEAMPYLDWIAQAISALMIGLTEYGYDKSRAEIKKGGK